MRLAGDEIGDKNDRGEPLMGDTILVLLNAHHDALPFMLPAARPEHHWLLLLDTSKPTNEASELRPEGLFELQGRSIAVFRTMAVTEAEPPISSLQVETLRKEALPPAPPQEKALLT